MKPVAAAALKEAVRKKIFIVMGAVTLLFLVLWAVLLYYFQNLDAVAEGSQFRSTATVLVTQLGLQFSSMLLCLLTIVLGAGAVASELETGLIHAVLSRPLGRASYVLGKYAGLACLSAACATLFYAALLLLGAAFSLSTVTALSPGRLLGGWAVYTLVPLGVLCLTAFGSVSLRAVPNGLLMIFVYILGNIGGMAEMIGNILGNTSVVSAGIFLSLVSPFHTLYTAVERILLPSTGLAGEIVRGLGGLTGGGRPASAAMYIYIAAYALGFLALAILRFNRKDIP